MTGDAQPSAGASLVVRARASVGSLTLDARIEVGAGCVAIAGPSGAGKTTLLRIAAGLLRPDDGEVRCGDEVWLDTARGVDLPPDRRRCGVVFQHYAIFPHLSARDNVAYGLRGLPRAERHARADELLDRLGVADRARTRPRDLSGGERQRVALARALAPAPRALLLDEPLSALDPRTRAAARRELGQLLRAAGVPVLLVTHDFAEAAQLADRVAILDAGRIVQQGAPADLALAPVSTFVADFTGASVLVGVARPAPEGLTAVALEGGGEIASTDVASGPVAASVDPWEVALEPAGRSPAPTSARNHVAATVATVTPLGNRARIGLELPQPLTAELTGAAVRDLRLSPGDRVVASWKATATRLVPR